MTEGQVQGGHVHVRGGQAPGPEGPATLQMGLPGFRPGMDADLAGGGGGVGPPCGAEKAAWGGRARALLYAQDDGGFCVPGRAGGVADVLARVLLGHPRDDECVAQPVLPGQCGERSLDQWIVGLGLLYGGSGRGWYRLFPRTGWGRRGQEGTWVSSSSWG